MKYTLLSAKTPKERMAARAQVVKDIKRWNDLMHKRGKEDFKITFEDVTKRVKRVEKGSPNSKYTAFYKSI